MRIFGREPAFWIGLIVSLIVAVISTLSTSGLISQALAGKVIDSTNLIAQLATMLAPLIAGLLIRPAVTSVAAPSLPAGTAVTVITPAASPNTTTVLPGTLVK